MRPTHRDEAVFMCCVVVALCLGGMSIYQTGYDNGKEHCKAPLPKMDLKRMTLRAQAKWATYLAGRTL